MMNASWPSGPASRACGARGRAAPGAGHVPGRPGHRAGGGAAQAAPRPARRARAGPGWRLGLDTACMLPPGRQQQELLTSLSAQTQQAVTDIRRIVYGLRPPALDELGWPAALREQAARLDGRRPGCRSPCTSPAATWTGCPPRLRWLPTGSSPRRSPTCSGTPAPRRCQIRIQPGQDLRLEVCDDGAGLPDGWRAGVGITAMRERAAELGGELVIEPSLPHGTRIVARMPTREQSSPN